jgi:hypothetical protein
MLVGVGGGVFAGGQTVPFVSLPSLSAYIAANFTPLSETLAFLHLIAFLYALTVMLGQWVEPPAQSAPREQMARDVVHGSSTQGMEIRL